MRHRHSPRPRPQRGVALITAVLIVALATILAINVSFNGMVDQRRSSNLFLFDQGFEVATRAKEIETVRTLDRVLSFVFVVLATISGGGYLFSLAASLWANVDRKRREIALLRLVGLGTGPVIGFPVVQAVLVALAGITLSTLLYLGVAAAFNAAFVSQLGRDEFVCRLSLRDGAAAAALTVLFAAAAAMVGGYRAAKIDPAEGLRAS